MPERAVELPSPQRAALHAHVDRLIDMRTVSSRSIDSTNAGWLRFRN